MKCRAAECYKFIGDKDKGRCTVNTDLLEQAWLCRNAAFGDLAPCIGTDRKEFWTTHAWCYQDKLKITLRGEVLCLFPKGCTQSTLDKYRQIIDRSRVFSYECSPDNNSDGYYLTEFCRNQTSNQCFKGCSVLRVFCAYEYLAEDNCKTDSKYVYPHIE